MVLTTAAGIGSIEAHSLDASDPMVDGYVRLLSGSLPAASGQMAVTEEAATRLGAGIGDVVTSSDETGRWTVTGVVEFPSALGERVLLYPGDIPASAGESRELTRWLVDVPGEVSWEDVLEFNDRGISVASRAMFDNPSSATTYSSAGLGGTDGEDSYDVALLVAGLGLVEVVLLAGPAFAVGARRRRRDLALVAINGATPAHLRRIVLADGVLLGAVAAGVGVVVGIVAAFGTRSVIAERVMLCRPGGYRVFPLALLGIAVLAMGTGLLAALAPAISVGRARLVESLAGRRATVRSSRWGILAGLLIVATGIGAGAHAAQTVDSRTLLVGLVLVVVGLVVCVPGLLGLLARLAPALPVSARMALRDTARNRAAAAPAVAAVLAAVATSAACGGYLASYQRQQTDAYLAGMPLGSVYVEYMTDIDASADWREPSNAVAQAVRSSLSTVSVIEIYGYDCGESGSSTAICALNPVVPDEGRCPLSEVSPPYAEEQQSEALTDSRCDGVSGRWRRSEGIVVASGDVGTLSYLDRGV